MIRKISKIGVLLLTLTFAMSCATRVEHRAHLTKEIEAVKSEFAPDKRVAVFAVEAEKTGKAYVLKGESNLPDAVQTLKNKLSASNIAYVDNIQMLPASSLGDKTIGLVTISVANLRSRPAHSAELATQATLGTPVTVLKKDNSWTLIQTPDKYLAWVDSGGIEDINQAEFDRWKAAKKIIYTTITGSSYSEPSTTSQVVSDVVAGGIFELLSEDENFYKVVYPDKRVAYISKTEAELYASWLSRTNPSNENLVATSKRLMGLPYLWGGTSPKGVDCSGFTKTIFFLNGLILPRDASQQIHTGDLIDDSQNFENLQPGDLLFFGRKATETSPERVIHVGMWIGNNEFIHSAGRVKINSVDKNAPNFDAYNLNRYLRTKRVVNSDVGEVIDLTETNVFEAAAQ
ncbi:SH3 domain-containing C40 family peptidase [uncultured Gelidibacter sp.]|uniref:C40 family peptidase n=1 Tax=uncultured Gelidibacter sp. TaxID=259318 RepID=UPI00262ADB82|nr:SH3 domain-containing C40 family peptidase [uncultured Gelidibacter sp.]